MSPPVEEDKSMSRTSSDTGGKGLGMGDTGAPVVELMETSGSGLRDKVVPSGSLSGTASISSDPDSGISL